MHAVWLHLTYLFRSDTLYATTLGRGHYVAVWWVRWLDLTLSRVLYFFPQAYGAAGFDIAKRRWRPWVPARPLDWLFRAQYWVEGKIAPRRHWMRWMPADSGKPNEVGFWMNGDLAKSMAKTGVERTRVFMWSSNTPSSISIP